MPSSNGVTRDMYGSGEWPSTLKWTAKARAYRVNSRQDFSNFQTAQVSALNTFTDRNLQTMNANYGAVVNGAPLTKGDAAYAAHFLGAGEGASCGYQASCIPEAAVRANRAYNGAEGIHQNMRMGRLA